MMLSKNLLFAWVHSNVKYAFEKKVKLKRSLMFKCGYLINGAKVVEYVDSLMVYGLYGVFSTRIFDGMNAIVSCPRAPMFWIYCFVLYLFILYVFNVFCVGWADEISPKKSRLKKNPEKFQPLSRQPKSCISKSRLIKFRLVFCDTVCVFHLSVKFMWKNHSSVKSCKITCESFPDHER